MQHHQELHDVGLYSMFRDVEVVGERPAEHATARWCSGNSTSSPGSVVD